MISSTKVGSQIFDQQIKSLDFSGLNSRAADCNSETGKGMAEVTFLLPRTSMNRLGREEDPWAQQPELVS